MKVKITAVAVIVASMALSGCGNSSTEKQEDQSTENTPNLFEDPGAAVDTVIDTVTTTFTDTVGQYDSEATIIENLQTMGDFTTLVAGLQATGLDVTLLEEGPFTVFAPNDDAFAKLGGNKVNELIATPDAFREVLLNHVLIEQTLDSSMAGLLAGAQLDTANGEQVDVGLEDDGTVTLNQANVTYTDIDSSNGIVHVVDDVLMTTWFD